MIPIKNAHEIKAMKEACFIAAFVLDRMCESAKPGVNTQDLDQLGKKLIEEMGAKSACYHYKIGSRFYPSYTCISINDEVVHGVGSPERVLQAKDSVSIDVSVSYNGFIGDNARTIVLESADEDVKKLVQATEEALARGIDQARIGNQVGDISAAIQEFVESQGYSVVRDFVGHGVGRSIHEEPQIPNFGRRNTGPKLKAGMTLAIEPMVNMGSYEVKYAKDGFTVVTKDGKRSAHFEHTVLITDEGPEILTISKN
ncbi:MAG: type I methionyl aminopeptidase [Verrucomicrobia bacterium]|nr:MAG: type I methionyl aminopeptidase [Verrucomicrobiota bacterium]